MNLLERSRKINKLLQHTNGKAVNFGEMSNTLADAIEANVFIISRRGKVLGYGLYEQIENDRMNSMLQEKLFPESYTDSMLDITETSANIDVEDPHSIIPIENKEILKNSLTTIVPVIGGGERLGTLILSRNGVEFEDKDIVLAEYGATVVGMEILREKAGEIEMEARSKAVVQMAISSLSYSELEAIEHIFEELDGKEGLLVASKIADRVGITRSVIVNALRKLESAGVIESRSLGMKGTFIKVLNDKFLQELDKIKSN